VAAILCSEDIEKDSKPLSFDIRPSSLRQEGMDGVEQLAWIEKKTYVGLYFWESKGPEMSNSSGGEKE
jgi:hypothetical protein